MFNNDIKEEASIEYSSNNSDEESEIATIEQNKKNEIIPPSVVKIIVEKIEDEEIQHDLKDDEEPLKKPKTRKPKQQQQQQVQQVKKSKGKKVFLKDTITTSEDEEVTKTSTKKGKILSIIFRCNKIITNFEIFHWNISLSATSLLFLYSEYNFYFSLFQNIETPEQPVIPDSIRFDPSKSLENKPKGLVDSLSKFFTPGMKRTSRTALSTLIKPPSELETATPINKKRKALFTSSGDDEGIIKKIMK